ncbi:MAG: helix-turn-helix transcriptional regulator [Bacteroidota bacterium]
MSKDHIDKRLSQLEEHLRKSSHKTDRKSVSDHSFYSYRHANRLFSARKGESIKTFATKIRLQKAAEYLAYSGRDMLDIALEVGYETVASFSKAFKKLYDISPSKYRELHKEGRHSNLHTQVGIPYSKESLVLPKLSCKKILFDLEIEEEDFYEKIKKAYTSLSPQAEEFMILWDEDPNTLQSGESRCFIAVPSSEDQLYDSPPEIKGTYAIFDTTAFEHLELNDWHKLAFLILEVDKVDMRVSTFVEYYSPDALDQIYNFYPNRIALPIK